MSRNYDPTIHLTGTDILDLELLDNELSTAYIEIISTIIRIISAQKAKELIFHRILEAGNENQNSTVLHPTPSEISAISGFINVYIVTNYTRIAFIRLSEVYSNILAGKTNYTITPNINIVTGFLFSCLGTSLKLIGSLQRIQEEGQITIL